MALTATVGAASAATCWKTKFKIENKSSSAIKLVDIDYWSEKDGKWRSKPTINRVLDPGEIHRDVRSLPGVKGERVQLRAKYRTKHNGRFKGGVSYEESVLYKGGCKKGKTYKVVIVDKN